MNKNVLFNLMVFAIGLVELNTSKDKVSYLLSGLVVAISIVGTMLAWKEKQ